MPFTSSVQPLCRACGKPIAKHTRSVWFGRTGSGTGFDSGAYRREKPRSRAEAQAMFNEQITAVRWNRAVRDGQRVPQEDYISDVYLWDGESYVDEFFHSGACATRLAYACARGGQALKPYNDAVLARRGQA